MVGREFASLFGGNELNGESSTCDRLGVDDAGVGTGLAGFRTRWAGPLKPNGKRAVDHWPGAG